MSLPVILSSMLAAGKSSEQDPIERERLRIAMLNSEPSNHGIHNINNAHRKAAMLSKVAVKKLRQSRNAKLRFMDSTMKENSKGVMVKRHKKSIHAIEQPKGRPNRNMNAGPIPLQFRKKAKSNV